MFRLLLKNQKEMMSLFSLETLTTMDRLAYLCDNRGKLDEAQELYEQVLKGREEVLGQTNAATLETVNDLACVYEYRGQLAKAEEYYKRALDGREKLLGLEHPDVLQTVADFAGLCHHQGRVSEGRATAPASISREGESPGTRPPGHTRLSARSRRTVLVHRRA